MKRTNDSKGGGARTTVWVASDHCTPHHSALAGCDRASTRVLMIESLESWREKPYHKRKLVLRLDDGHERFASMSRPDVLAGVLRCNRASALR